MTTLESLIVILLFLLALFIILAGTVTALGWTLRLFEEIGKRRARARREKLMRLP